ncbi:hypothetical protein FJZ19_05175 [Candidatus Pacearchaeota archaeon]|nr:hypothetical protein [Candidatus Pacearchaeota archaeon]
MESFASMFGRKEAKQLRKELASNRGKCHFDRSSRKIVYNSCSEAFQAYIEIERRKMSSYAQARSRNSKDLEALMLEWIKRNAKSFNNNWRRTHVYVLSEKVIKRAEEEAILEYVACELSREDF